MYCLQIIWWENKGFQQRSWVATIPHREDMVCTVSLSLFAGLERILRRFSIFAGEPRKSIITTTEPCNPVFKEAQPRPSKQKLNQLVIIFEFTCYVMFLEENCFCNKASNRIVLTLKGFSVFFWITLSHEVSRYFPKYTYIDIRELKEPSTYSLDTNR